MSATFLPAPLNERYTFVKSLRKRAGRGAKPRPTSIAAGTNVGWGAGGNGVRAHFRAVCHTVDVDVHHANRGDRLAKVFKLQVHFDVRPRSAERVLFDEKDRMYAGRRRFRFYPLLVDENVDRPARRGNERHDLNEVAPVFDREGCECRCTLRPMHALLQSERTEPFGQAQCAFRLYGLS